jgi:hypothetical protein
METEKDRFRFETVFFFNNHLEHSPLFNSGTGKLHFRFTKYPVIPNQQLSKFLQGILVKVNFKRRREASKCRYIASKGQDITSKGQDITSKCRHITSKWQNDDSKRGDDSLKWMYDILFHLD